MADPLNGRKTDDALGDTLVEGREIEWGYCVSSALNLSLSFWL